MNRIKFEGAIVDDELDSAGFDRLLFSVTISTSSFAPLPRANGPTSKSLTSSAVGLAFSEDFTDQMSEQSEAHGC